MGSEAVVPHGLLAILKRWNKKTWIIVGSATTIILIIIIAVSVTEVEKANAYPDYSAINYTLVDTYSGEDFFDNFDYFTAAGGYLISLELMSLLTYPKK